MTRNISHDTPSDLDDIPYLGYKSGMRHETVVAARWGSPLAEYLKTLVAADIAASTVNLRSYQIRVLSRGFLESSPWEVTGDQLVEFLADQVTWGTSAKRAARSAYRGFFAWGVKRGHIAVSPADSLGKIKQADGKPRPAPRDSIRHAVEVADERTRMMVYFGAHAGLRRVEISRIHTSDLVRDDDGWSLRVLGKGRKIRHVPLTGTLSSWLLTRPEGWAFPSYHRGHDDGRPSDRHLSVDRVGKLISACLGTGVSPHMLRHRFATDYYQTTGNDLLKVQKALGHTSVATTQIYTEIPAASMRAGIDALERLAG